MTRETFWNRAEENLQVMSRTANGVLDTSASADKEGKMAVADGMAAKDLAVRNFSDALDLAWENRHRVFGNPTELRGFIEILARTVNRGLLRDGILYRGGADSVEYRYTPVAKIEASAAWFYGHLFELLCREEYDAVEAAAAAEYYINLTVHFFADGCGKCAMVTAAWLLMRGNHPLPVYASREEYYGVCRGFQGAPAGSEGDAADFGVFLEYYRSLFEDGGAECGSASPVTIPLPPRIDSLDAGDVEAQVRSILRAVRAESVRMDAAETEYISSAGMRMLLHLINEKKNPVLLNASETVYEVMDMSGFTSLMRVDRRLKEISTEGCEMIGRGMNGSVYRYAPDTIVKIYTTKNNLEDVRREQQMSRFCFISGLPTAIPLNLVREGNHLGAMYELLDAKTMTREFSEHPEQREELAEQYIALMKKIHGIVPQVQNLPMKITLPEKKKLFLGWASELEGVLDRETFEKLCRVFGDIPERNSLLHGDPSLSNIMREKGELLLIDLDDIGIGDPAFDLANFAASQEGFPVLVHFDALGWEDTDLRRWVMWRVLNGYYAGLGDREREEKVRLVLLCMHTRVARYALKHDYVSEKDRKAEIKRLYDLISAYH